MLPNCDGVEISELIDSLPFGAVVKLVVTIPEKPMVKMYYVDESNKIFCVGYVYLKNYEYLVKDIYQTYYKNIFTDGIFFTMNKEDY